MTLLNYLIFSQNSYSFSKQNTKAPPLAKIIQNDWNIFSEKSLHQNILTDILAQLSFPFTDQRQPVEYIEEITESVEYWELLKKELKWERRFLANIGKMENLGWNGFFNQRILLSDSIPLFRARINTTHDQGVFSKEKMGCPPKHLTAGGRANPQGIPYLYLCKEIETTIYEIRATFLDEVSVGTFRIKKGITTVLIDFTENKSVFLNIENILEYTKSVLLKKKISADLSKPMRRYDSELEYIPTQFICEFIRYITGADGILFNSSLYKGGKNIVLFDQEKAECISVAPYKVFSVNIKVKKKNNVKPVDPY